MTLKEVIESIDQDELFISIIFEDANRAYSYGNPKIAKSCIKFENLNAEVLKTRVYLLPCPGSICAKLCLELKCHNLD